MPKTLGLLGLLVVLTACPGNTPGEARWDGTLVAVRSEPLPVAGPDGTWIPQPVNPLQLLWGDTGFLALASEWSEGQVFLRLEWIDAEASAVTRSARVTDPPATADEGPASGAVLWSGSDLTLFYTDALSRLWVRQVAPVDADVVLGPPRLVLTGPGSELSLLHALRTDGGYALILSSDQRPAFLSVSVQGEPQGDLVALRDPGPQTWSRVTDAFAAPDRLRVLVEERDTSADVVTLLTLNPDGSAAAPPVVVHEAADLIGGSISSRADGGVTATFWDLAAGIGLASVDAQGTVAPPVGLGDLSLGRPRHVALDDDHLAVLAESGELTPGNPIATTLSLAVASRLGAPLARILQLTAPGGETPCIEQQTIASGDGCLGVLWIEGCRSTERELRFQQIRIVDR